VSRLSRDDGIGFGGAQGWILDIILSYSCHISISPQHKILFQKNSLTTIPESGKVGIYQFQILIMAIKSFKNKGTEDVNYGRSSKDALKILPKELHRKAQIKLARLGAVTSMQDLQDIRGNRFEKLKGDRKGQYSIRINDRYRICFSWENENALDVEIVDYH
jgi:proteic killer suppression protein